MEQGRGSRLRAAGIGALVAAWALWAGLAAAADGAAAAMDLDHFDGAKRIAHLPDGIDLAYIDTGNPQGAPMVLIHGFTDNARDWFPLLPYLPPARRIIVVDIRGHGLSSKPECCYQRLDFAYDIKLLLDALHIERADIVGHSLGSFIAQTFAEYWPEHTRKVVLVASSGGARPGTCAPPKFDTDFVAQIRKLKEPLDPDSPFMISWWSSPTKVDDEFLRRQRQDSARIPLRVWLAVLDQGLAGAELQATLPRLTSPTLLIWGELDPIMGEDARASLREGLPKAQVKFFPGLGHNPFWEDPKAVAASINGFLDAQ